MKTCTCFLHLGWPVYNSAWFSQLTDFIDLDTVATVTTFRQVCMKNFFTFSLNAHSYSTSLIIN